MAVIETDGLTKLYGKARGIEDVTFAVKAGEVFGFLGPNGAGKTTAIRTLLDMLHPTSGSARIFGLDSQRDSVAIRTASAIFPAISATASRPAGGMPSAYSLACGRLRGLAAPRLWPSAFAPTSIAPSASSPAATGRRSGSSSRAFTHLSC